MLLKALFEVKYTAYRTVTDCFVRWTDRMYDTEVLDLAYRTECIGQIDDSDDLVKHVDLVRQANCKLHAMLGMSCTIEILHIYSITDYEEA